MFEIIESDGMRFAIIVRSDFDHKGVQFFTDGDDLLELGYMKHAAGNQIQSHFHLPVSRHTVGTQEVLFIKSGKVKIVFYDTNNVFAADRTLSSGDCILLVAGGHSFEFLEETKMIEVKNGPYLGDLDKVRF